MAGLPGPRVPAEGNVSGVAGGLGQPVRVHGYER